MMGQRRRSNNNYLALAQRIVLLQPPPFILIIDGRSDIIMSPTRAARMSTSVKNVIKCM